MIKIKEMRECCGCEACVQRCPVGCISLVEDNEGFRYPQVDVQRCVDCGACESVCPELNLPSASAPLKVVGAKSHSEELRSASSSGGIFSLLAADVIASQGVVFGAVFDSEWGVVHRAAQTLEELEPMRGSKYSQSQIGDCFARAEELLQQGREVLFSGTPCQIAGLRLFLGREYDKLLLVDVTCHGAPSPKLWRKYLGSVAGGARVNNVNFRDKSNGWRNYSLTIEGEGFALRESHIDNSYMQAFIKGLSLRPSCFACPAKCGRSGSDITLADFWSGDKAVPKFMDNRGVSLLLVGTEKGVQRLSKLDFESAETTYSAAVSQSGSHCLSAREPQGRAKLFDSIDGDVMGCLRGLLSVPLYTRIIWIVKRLYAKMIYR